MIEPGLNPRISAVGRRGASHPWGGRIEEKAFAAASILDVLPSGSPHYIVL